MSSLSILVVEDDHGASILLRKLIERLGHNGYVVNSGRDALDWLKLPNPTDLMLIDNKLNDMDGLELIKKVRGLGHNFPFVVMTGQGDEQTAVSYMKIGAEDYLVKDSQFWLILPTVIRKVIIKIQSNTTIDSKITQRKSTYAIFSANVEQAVSYLNNLDMGIYTDPETYFNEHPNVVKECIDKITLDSINENSTFFKVPDEENKRLRKFLYFLLKSERIYSNPLYIQLNYVEKHSFGK